MTPRAPDPRRRTGAPPTRYRVVERGRRLEVIDTRASAGALPPRLPGGVERTRFDGGGTLTTHAAYDAKGPRTIRLGGSAVAMVGRVRVVAVVAVIAFVVLAVWQPFALAVPVLLAQRGVRDGVRGVATRWLDRLADRP